MDDIQGLLLRVVFEYRYFALLLLSLGMIGLPVPDEFVMAFTGFGYSLDRYLYYDGNVFRYILGEYRNEDKA